MERRKKNDRLTPLENEIMNVLWEISPATVQTVRQRLERELAYTTVQTVMNTLEKKGLLKRKKTGLVNFYRPTRSRDEAVRSEMTRLISRVFHGSVPALASHLIEAGSLTLNEIETIQDLLDRRANEIRIREKGGTRRG